MGLFMKWNSWGDNYCFSEGSWFWRAFREFYLTEPRVPLLRVSYAKVPEEERVIYTFLKKWHNIFRLLRRIKLILLEIPCFYHTKTPIMVLGFRSAVSLITISCTKTPIMVPENCSAACLVKKLLFDPDLKSGWSEILLSSIIPLFKQIKKA